MQTILVADGLAGSLDESSTAPIFPMQASICFNKITLDEYQSGLTSS